MVEVVPSGFWFALAAASVKAHGSCVAPVIVGGVVITSIRMWLVGRTPTRGRKT